MSVPFEEGHNFVYRVTVYNSQTKKMESHYYADPRAARLWRVTGFETSVARAPAGAFEEIDDAALDELGA